MSKKTNIISTGRDIYFNPNGRDNFSGTSVANAVDSPATAIERVNALVPSPSIFSPASITASETGAFFDGIEVPDSVAVNAGFAAILTTDAVNVTAGNSQRHEWGALINQANDGVNFLIDGKSRISADISTTTVGSDTIGVTGTTGNIGYKVTGAVDDIFIETKKMNINGDGATSIMHTASSSTPVRYEADSVEFFNRDQTFFTMNSPNLFDQVTLNLTTIQESSVATQPTTGSCMARVVKGILSITAKTLVADHIAVIGADAQLSIITNGCIGDITLEDNANANIIASGLWIGDITIGVGATLRVDIQNYVGTINNPNDQGTIHGTINGECYGDHCQMKGFVESLPISATMNDFLTNPVEKFNETVTIDEDGDYEYWLSFTYRVSTTNRSIEILLKKDGVPVLPVFREKMADSSNVLSLTKRFPRTALTEGDHVFSLEFGRGGGAGAATVTLSDVILEVRKIPPEF